MTENKPKTFMDVVERDSCRFIAGTDEKPAYCGNARVAGTAWCAEHRAIVYTKQKGGAA